MTTITILPADIAKGLKRSCTACPIARAINRVLAPDWRVTVGTPNCGIAHREVNMAEVFTIKRLPKTAQMFIKSFDSGIGRNSKPISFKLNIPIKYLRS